jgi:hypothetical protein
MGARKVSLSLIQQSVTGNKLGGRRETAALFIVTEGGGVKALYR